MEGLNNFSRLQAPEVVSGCVVPGPGMISGKKLVSWLHCKSLTRRGGVGWTQDWVGCLSKADKFFAISRSELTPVPQGPKFQNKISKHHKIQKMKNTINRIRCLEPFAKS